MKADPTVNQSHDTGRRILFSSIEERSRNRNRARMSAFGDKADMGRKSVCL
jgi:hypothetical protein